MKMWMAKIGTEIGAVQLRTFQLRVKDWRVEVGSRAKQPLKSRLPFPVTEIPGKIIICGNGSGHVYCLRQVESIHMFQ